MKYEYFLGDDAGFVTIYLPVLISLGGCFLCEYGNYHVIEHITNDAILTVYCERICPF